MAASSSGSLILCMCEEGEEGRGERGGSRGEKIWTVAV